MKKTKKKRDGSTLHSRTRAGEETGVGQNGGKVKHGHLQQGRRGRGTDEVLITNTLHPAAQNCQRIDTTGDLLKSKKAGERSTGQGSKGFDIR